MRSTGAEIDEVLGRATGAGAGMVPGLVAIAATSREILYEGAFGARDVNTAVPMTLDTVGFYASMTKALTTAAAMQLVEQGRLSLDGPIAAVLPDLAAPQVLEGFDAEGRPRLRAARTPITLRQLMTHTAGFGYEIWNAGLNRYLEQTGTPSIFRCENVALRAPLIAEPGVRWEYSISIDLVGKAVEAASGQRLDDYLGEHLFGPLGMADTGFVPNADQRARCASLHVRQADGTLTPTPFAMPAEPEFFMGGGGLFGTAPDYVRFIRMLLNHGTLDGRRLLRPDTVDLMGRNNMGSINTRPLKTAIPGYSNDVDFYPSQDKKWGLSFLINTEKTEEGRSAGSLSWAGLFNSYYWIDPVRDVGGVILMQILPFADEGALDVFRAFERAVYQSLDRDRRAA